MCAGHEMQDIITQIAIFLMSKPLSEKAFAITGRCSRNKNLFGISVDEVSRGQFSFVWSFKLDEAKAKREGFESKSVTGGIRIEPDFPGCPYCGAKTFVFCGRCGMVSCHNGEGTSTCPGCGYTSRVEVAESFDLKGGSY